MEFKTPPLNALKAFDAIVRTQSISKAAKVLDVTQSAIIQQQKLLESYLGMHLFQRSGKQLKLTTEGETYAKQINAIFDNLRLATKELVHHQISEKTLVVNTTTASILQTLIPHLPQFQQKYPHIEIRLSSSTTPILNPHEEDIDLGIYWGHPNDWLNCKTIPLIKIEKQSDTPSEMLYLVYSPKIEKKEKFIVFKEWITETAIFNMVR